MKRILALLLAALVLTLVLAPGAFASETVPCLTIDSKLVLIGDSNTTYLAKNCEDIRAAQIISRVGASVGETVKQITTEKADGSDKTMYELVQALSGFDTVVINMGTNNLGSEISYFDSFYRMLLDLLYKKNPKAVVYLCKILPVNENNYRGDYKGLITNANVAEINQHIEGFVEEYTGRGCDARLLDMHTPFLDAYGQLDTAYDRGDGVHLADASYPRMNEVLQTALAQGDLTLPHSWGSASVALPPTCVDEGSSVTTCAICGAQQYETLPATGAHQWVPAAADSPDAGKSVCSVCGTVAEDVVPAAETAAASAPAPTSGGKSGIFPKILLLPLLLALLLFGLWALALRAIPKTRRFHGLAGFHYAHRGLYGFDRGVPENSKSGFRLAVRHGYGAELDVHLSRDKRLVVMHDENLFRTTGLDLTIQKARAEDLAPLRLEGSNEEIPYLEEILPLFDGLTPLVIEIKPCGDNYDRLTNRVCKLLDQFPNLRFCIESFDPRVLIWLRKNRPEIVRGQLAMNFLPIRHEAGFGWPTAFALTNLLGNFLAQPDFVAYKYEDRGNLSFRLCKKLWKVQEFSWTIHSPEEAEEIERDGGIIIFEDFDA